MIDHPFVGFYESASDVPDEQDLEQSGGRKICYICKFIESMHSETVDEFIERKQLELQSNTDVNEPGLMKNISLAIMQKIKSEAEAIKDEQAEDYCPVCYEQTIKEGEANTFKFGCSHLFCRECAKEGLAMKV